MKNESKFAAYFRKMDDEALIAVFINRPSDDGAGLVKAVQFDLVGDTAGSSDMVAADPDYVLNNSVDITDMEEIGKLAIACGKFGFTFLIVKE